MRIHYTARLCNHCDRAACLAACPHGAIYRREDKLVLIDPEKCQGCRACQAVCPYDVIFFNDDLGVSQKCTGCAHLLDHGVGQPRCADACPTDALVFGEEEDLQDFIVGAQVLEPESGLRPRVYYRNIPGSFIAGAVYDPVEKEVVIGAKCRATNGYKTIEARTDDYGDFWFNDLQPGIYEVVIEAVGYEYKVFERVNAVSSVNLGDIPLARRG
ncbi:MAG: 4Fe-4S dicluster domain-containing protein [Oscillospiraceae bacterium]|nr:4Fe-4S dicluster domain-containing protein [Oscillospiraceae bacterium]